MSGQRRSQPAGPRSGALGHGHEAERSHRGEQARQDTEADTPSERVGQRPADWRSEDPGERSGAHIPRDGLVALLALVPVADEGKDDRGREAEADEEAREQGPLVGRRKRQGERA